MLVCENFSNRDRTSCQSYSEKEYIFSICEILCHAAPSCVIEEDEDGMSPIEIAIINEMDFSFVKKLQRSAMKQKRIIAKRNEQYWEENKQNSCFCRAA
mmetsp:Transcript_61996/g.72500  ORF Transcript_61996/g.72500 Transcript_61996/m.72500 type:complete len:99 (-) Transcript_61996:121-417(-)